MSDLASSRLVRPADSSPAPSSNPDSILVRAETLSLFYHGVPAFRDVTLSLRQRCITALIGPSGSGKTSLLMALNRLTDLLPGCKVTGRLRVGTLDVLAPQTDVTMLRRRVGMIFQKPNPFPLSIRENLALPLREHGMRGRGQIAELTELTLRDVGLWEEVRDRLDGSALSLSGGQQQRLCLARALILRPEVLLMDEPCSALDPLSSGVVEDLISLLRATYTIVIVTHNLAQAKRIADDVALLWVQEGGGNLVEFGPAHQLFTAPREPLTAAYVSGARG